MALKIGELLIQHNVITQEQLEKALLEQQHFGGKLGTNLVELGFITDANLASFLSKQLNMPAAKMTDFDHISPSVLAMIPKDLAGKYQAIPLRFEKKLITAVSGSMDLSKLDELEFKIGKTISAVVAPEIWIVASLERYYGIPREARYIAIEDDQLQSKIASLQEEIVLTTLAGESTLSLNEYVKRLLEAQTKKDVFVALLEFISAYAPQSAVYLLNKETVTGGLLHGFPIHLGQFQKTEVTLEGAVTFKKILTEHKSYFGDLPAGGGDAMLVGVLGISSKEKVAIHPISYRGKAVAALLMRMKENASEGILKLVIEKAGYALELGALRKIISELPG